MSGDFYSYKVDSEVLRLAHEIVSDPETRAKIKAALEEEGKPGMSALIDEAVVVARELIRLAELQRDGPKSGWNDCDDRMPESGDEVLVYHVLGDRSGAPMTIDIATWGNSKKWIYPWDRGGINPTPWLVTHWHPLPSIPATSHRQEEK